mgnify:CR=1 FL=1
MSVRVWLGLCPQPTCVHGVLQTACQAEPDPAPPPPRQTHCGRYTMISDMHLVLRAIHTPHAAPRPTTQCMARPHTFCSMLSDPCRPCCCLPQEVEAAEQKAASEAAARAASEAAALAPSKQLAAALTLRGYKMTLPEVKLGARKPFIDGADGSVHWPVLLMYPETGQQDVIQDWHEDDPVEAHLDVVSHLGACGVSSDS